MISGTPPRRRALLVAPAAAAAATLWLAAWPFALGRSAGWSKLAIGVFAVALGAALSLIARRALALPPGPERRALALVFWSGLVAAAGGVSDFAGDALRDFPKVGPMTLLLFLLVLCAVTVRDRFLDVGDFFLRAAALLAAGAAAALVYFGVTRLFGAGYVALLVASVALLALAGPLLRRWPPRARAFFTLRDPLARAMLETSRELSSASLQPQIRAALDRAEARLPPGVRVAVRVRDAGGDLFRALEGDETEDPRTARPRRADEPLPRRLAREGLPVTARTLERDALETRGAHAAEARAALVQLEELGARIVVPMRGAERLLGWIAITGDLPDSDLTGELAAALLALANQAAAGLERAEALEQARRGEALAAVGAFAAGLAHEVRNPVAAIRGAAQALESATDEAQRKEMLEVIDEETARLGRFLGEFLEYARPRDPEPADVDAADLARACVDRYRLGAGDAAVAVEVDDALRGAAGAHRRRARVDPDQVHRALGNLLRNAAEAGARRVVVRVEPDGTDARVVVLRVLDDGSGIPPDRPASIFRPFVTTRPRGTGLGLALAQRVAEANGGSLTAANRPEGGAELRLALPLAPPRARGDNPTNAEVPS